MRQSERGETHEKFTQNTYRTSQVLKFPRCTECTWNSASAQGKSHASSERDVKLERVGRNYKTENTAEKVVDSLIYRED